MDALDCGLIDCLAGFTMRPRIDFPSSDPPAYTAGRVVIVEDHRSTAEMLELLCTEHWGLMVVAVAHSCVSGLRAVIDTPPDLVLLDVGLPDGNGLSLLPQLRSIIPAAQVIVLSSLFSDCVLDKLCTLPWNGLHDKVSDGLRSLQEAIQSVRTGRRYISPSVRRLLSRHHHSSNPIRHMLSEREKEVLEHIAHAQSDEEIAEHLGIDRSTVHTHRKQLLKKLDLHSTPKLMHYAFRHGYGSMPLPTFPRFAGQLTEACERDGPDSQRAQSPISVT